MKIEIIETLSKIIEVDMTSETHAILEVKKEYNEERIVLDEQCLIDVEFHLYQK